MAAAATSVASDVVQKQLVVRKAGMSRRRVLLKTLLCTCVADQVLYCSGDQVSAAPGPVIDMFGCMEAEAKTVTQIAQQHLTDQTVAIRQRLLNDSCVHVMLPTSSLGVMLFSARMSAAAPLTIDFSEASRADAARIFEDTSLAAAAAYTE
jgi:hypothetical protein